MNKRKLVLTGLLGFTFLLGCSQVDDGVSNVSASNNLPKGFTVVTEDESIRGYQSVYTLKNEFTNCFYVLTEGWESTSMIQMFIEKDGVSVPYCDK